MTEDAAVIYVVDDDQATRHALSSLLRDGVPRIVAS